MTNVFFFIAAFFFGAAFQENITGTEHDIPDKGYRSMCSALLFFIIGMAFIGGA